MNRIYRTVFNQSTGTCQAVCETASSHGGAGSSAGTSLAVPRLSRLTTACLLSLAALAGNPALADGGNGGNSLYGFSGGTGGNANAVTADGGAGASSDYNWSGGGGGGGGGVSLIGLSAGSGGAGGNGGAALASTNPVATGGAGGTVGANLLANAPLGDITGGAGSAGTAQGLSGGGGGGGGGFGAVALQPGTLTNAFTVSGGTGGAGATGNNYGGGGGGGEGGGGLLLATGDTSLLNTNTGVITGASGGAGGNDAMYYYPGAGGQGGQGLVVQGAGVVVMNAGHISGGAGGNTGLDVDGQYRSDAGNGGTGVVGADLTIINSGTISGGAAGVSWGTAGNAIEFTAGINKLELHGGAVINGGVLANGASDILALTGNADGILAFNDQFSGFEVFEKTGTALWTLTGQPGDLPTLDLREGGLQIGDGETSTSLSGKPGVFNGTADDGLGNGTGAAGGMGQALVNVAGGALGVKANAEIYGGNGASGGNSYANPAGESAAVVGAAGGAGGAAVVFTQGSLSNEGGIWGGAGGQGGYAYLNTNDSSETFGVSAFAVTAVSSGSFTGGAGGAGGDGVATSSSQTVTNNGVMGGGRGGEGRYEAIDQSSVTASALTGGAGGDGGNGILFTAVGALDNQASLYGGSAGRGGGTGTESSGDAALTGGAGGTGGAGALFALGGTALSSGDIAGGYGGQGGYANAVRTYNPASDVVQVGAGGAGGHGIAMLAAGSVTNSGSVEGGGGGSGGTQVNYTSSENEASTTAQGASGGAGAAGVFFAANGALSNSASGVIMGGQGGSSNVNAGAYTSNEGAGVAQLTINSAASAAGGAGVHVGGIAAVTNDGMITGGLGGGSSYSGGGDDFSRASGSPGNDGYAQNYYGQEATATVHGNTGGTGGAALVLAGGGLATNNASGTLQGGQGGTSSADASVYTVNESTSLTATAIGDQAGMGGSGADLASGSTLVNAGTVWGGQGGEGGYASAWVSRDATPAALAVTSVAATGGNGGTGGTGVTGSHAKVVNLAGGIIAGGEGGIAGGANVEQYASDTGYQYNDGTFGAAGAGGVGITGSDLAVVNAGTISGGLSGGEAFSNVPSPLAVQEVALPGTRTRAAAIQFTGGVNSLTLESTSVIEGKVIAFTAADTLALGGATNSAFDVAAIGPDAQYSGFGQFGKTGAGTWTLTGFNTAITPWTVNAGTLAIASDASLGAVGGALTLAGGTLQTTTDITTSRAIKLTAPGGTLSTDAATTLALSGAVTGNGALTKDGTGTLRLTGANSYSGGTTITAGTLVAGVPGLGTGAIVDNAALVIDEASNATMANSLSGNGAVTKTGTGQVLYTGNGADFNGALLVSSGTFSANGTLGGTTTIASGATLKGSGTIGTTILSSGATLAPGNSIGTLTVNGDFTFAPGSRYEVEANAAGQSDLLRVSGTAALGGASVVVLAANGSYAPSTTYTILTSGNRVGTFGSVSSNFAFLDPTLRYVANDVQLTLVRNTVAFPAFGTTLNQKASAGALESLGSGTLFNAVVQLDAATAQSAFNQLSGEIHASAQTAMLEDSRFAREAGLDRVRQAQGGTSSGITVQDQGAGNNTWARVFGSKGHIDGDGNASRLNRDIAGFFAGADTTTASGWRAGGLVGYSKADLDTSGLNATAKTDSYHVGVYGGNQWDNTALRVGASYSWNKLDTQRNVGFTGFTDSLKSRYDASTTQIFGEIGQKMDMGSMALEPFAGLAYVNVDTKDVRENGGAAALRSGGGSIDSIFSTLGVRASTSLSESTKLRGTLGWRHAFGNKTPTSSNAFATGQSFTVAGVPLAKNVAVVEAGVETQLQSKMTLGASYAGQFGNGLKDHGFKVTLGWKF
ncbi:MAG: outer rane autotransporter barrel domain protein [Polaromonas sp.]|nr:outer rane autotransporter barrel domain protein [Polaromonas sp.]